MQADFHHGLLTRAVVAVLVWGALSFGAVYPWGYWPLATACAAIGVWTIHATGGWSRPWTKAWLAVFGALVLAIGLQVIPLPYAWFTRLSPAADQLLADYDTAYSVQPPDWHALSISPGSTLTVLLLLAALTLFVVGLSAAMSRIPLHKFASAVAILGISLVIFGVVQLAFVTDNKPVVYGFWRVPLGALPFGPFINKNHYAGWMLMAVPIVLGYFCAMVQASWRERGGRLGRFLHWATRPEAGWTALIGFCVLAMATSIVLSKSRSGIVGFAIVLLVFGIFLVRNANRRLGRLVAASAILGFLALAVVWAGSDATASHFAQSSRDLPGRLEAWRDTVRIIRQFPWFGTGLGTYWMAMLVYQTGPRDQIFFQAHNDYLQVAAEGGLLVCVPAVVVVIALAVSATRRFADRDDLLTYWLRAGAIAGIVGMAAQSLVEFSLQTPGNTALFVVLLALAIHPPRVRTARAHRM
jgi:O-antigen ligase